ncbi:hypothetical protein IQ07DRAFT_22538 [Pyrenochaeta sp. DS3sAY3a]|nr:hypothetical protein IQ07DRAFT_22538 [Pyrenochaeta sp. DS3sAY3a]
MFKNMIISLLSLASLALALPGGTSEYPPKETLVYPPPPPPPGEEICTPSYWTVTSVGEEQTTYLSTETVVIPITSVIDKETTSLSECLSTSTGFYTTTIVSLTTYLATNTYSTVTTIYDTVVESDVVSDTFVETVPTTSVGTEYKTSIGTVQETIVTTQTSESVCTQTVQVPITSVSTGTTEVCTTKGYGDGY